METYQIIRAEIITNHVLIHVSTLAIILVLFGGIYLVEKRNSILSIFLPLVSLAWAAGIVRFDFFIHRQAKYLRALEATMDNTSLPLWETWKAASRTAGYVVPVADIIGCLAIVIPTLYVLFGPSRKFFESRQMKGGILYSWAVSAILVLLLLSLAVIPIIT